MLLSNPPKPPKPGLHAPGTTYLFLHLCQTGVKSNRQDAGMR
jgi:hypothetical protein